jgi:DNA polymerase I-like protein with 3'-5' exonuclease and polymerase domains
MLLSVHDELVFEVPRRSVKREALVRTVMEKSGAESLKVNIASGDNWAAVH